jgi:DNA-binding Lrp family transcriptional regulator
LLSQLDKNIIRKLQDELPLIPEPYKAIAEDLGITEGVLLERVKELQKEGILRRLGAILHHRKAGYDANAMVVWVVPDEKILNAGEIMSSFTQVSHCYQRVASPGWPYNMFIMVHAKTKQECEEIVCKIADATQVYEYEFLYSTDEKKKSSMKYFMED